MTGMAKQLELEQEARYARLIGGKVVYITEAEALVEEVLTTTDDRLGERNQLVSEANRLKKHIGLVHQMMKGDDPSQYQAVYDTLWNQYRDIIESLRELDPETVAQFRDKVTDRVKELEVRLNDLCDNWDPDYFDYLERTLSCYEKDHDLMVALDEDSPLSNAREVARRTREYLANRGWCLWQCRALCDEVIAVVREENVEDVPEGYAVFTMSEIRTLFGGDKPVNHNTLKLIAEAKKRTAVRVTSRATNK